MQTDWETTARSKRATLHDAISPAWRLTDAEIPDIHRLRDVTQFIQRFLNPLELKITNATPVVILDQIQKLEWSAFEVTRAFCHRASIAHQLVRILHLW